VGGSYLVQLPRLQLCLRFNIIKHFEIGIEIRIFASISALHARTRSTAEISFALESFRAPLLLKVLLNHILIFLDYFAHDCIVTFAFRERRQKCISLVAQSGYRYQHAAHQAASHCDSYRYWFCVIWRQPKSAHIVKNIRDIFLERPYLSSLSSKPCQLRQFLYLLLRNHNLILH
jgi:hypothetical protein